MQLLHGTLHWTAFGAKPYHSARVYDAKASNGGLLVHPFPVVSFSPCFHGSDLFASMAQGDSQLYPLARLVNRPSAFTRSAAYRRRHLSIGHLSRFIYAVGPIVDRYSVNKLELSARLIALWRDTSPSAGCAMQQAQSILETNLDRSLLGNASIINIYFCPQVLKTSTL